MKVFSFKHHYIYLVFIIALLTALFIFLFNDSSIIHMDSNNYTQILLDSHTNFSKFIGKKILTSGYIFRTTDFDSNKFVIARDMLIDKDSSNIVGFLCEYTNATDFETNSWVEGYGTIYLGNYYGPIPIIKIHSIKKITTPEDIFVYPPNK